MTELELRGRLVVITGAAGGIGRETAARFVGAGARVALGDLDARAAGATAEAIGGESVGLFVDVRDRESFATFLCAAADRFGLPQVLVNNAGVMPLGAYTNEDEQTSQRAVDVNLWGVLHGTRLVLPGMVERGSGHIVNVASMMGRMHAPGAATYTATKFGVVGFSAAIRDEVYGTGVSVTTVLPSAVRTPLISGLDLGAFPPVVEPYEVAAAILATCTHRRPEVAVPRWMGRIPEIERLLPRALTVAARRRFGGDRALHGVDAAARAEYEQRVREMAAVQ